MAVGFLSPDAFMRVITALGVVAPGAKLYTYVTGSSTPTSIYTSRALTVATANPLVADSGGLFAAFWLDPTVVYRFELKTSAGVTIAGPIDGISVGRGSGVSPYTYIAKTGTYTAVAGDLVAATSGTFTVTLPAASANANAAIAVVNNGTGTITIGRTGTDTVGLATSQTLNPATATAQGDSMTFVSDGVSNWNIL